jgi:hypothetical protein
MIYVLALFAGFAFGYMTCSSLQMIKEQKYSPQECDICKIKVCLPFNSKWAYEHECSNEKSTTFISKINENHEEENFEKISGVGKTLC